MGKFIDISRRVTFQAIKHTLLNSVIFAEELKLRIELRLELAKKAFLLIVAKHLTAEVPKDVAAYLVESVVLAGK